ncbi:MAG: type IV toxin-antitoxin system AbiEi family antitoxin domain-containing protein [Spirochaetales bacterium]|nr:type IV toxin-antitoxin system AbiEi family antitoxin domain-containing protein [Spirochaetales bacterium]
MKLKQKELGKVATRFFAYVQLRKMETIEIGDLTEVLGLTAVQEQKLLYRLSRAGWIVRLRRGLYLVPSRIQAGQWSPGIYLSLQKLMEDCNGQYQICGPSAFNYYSFSQQIPNTTYVYNNRLSGERTIGSLEFVFIKVADSRLGSVNTFITPDGANAIYSSKARTLMDAVYDWSRFNSLPRAYEWVRGVARNDTTLCKELVECCLLFGNQATIRRVGYLLDQVEIPVKELEKLRVSLKSVKSVIPWRPDKKAKGKVNRSWGVIVNE